MKRIIKEYSQQDLEVDIKNSGSAIKGQEMTNGGSLNPSFVNILGYIFKSGLTKGCKVTITAGNDNWHHKNAPNSEHTKGNAVDMVVPDQSCRQNIKKYIDTLKKQYSVSYLDEYEHPSAKATGGHLHIQYGGTPLKSGDETTGVFSSFTQQNSSQSLTGGDFLRTATNVAKGMLGLNESFSVPLKNQKRNSGTSKKYVIDLSADDKVISPLDGKIISIGKPASSNLYKVEILHDVNGKKLRSVIEGFNESLVSNGEKVKKNKVIGKIYKNSKLTWEIFDERGHNIDIISLMKDDEGSDILDKKNNKSVEKTTLLKSMIGLNPVSLALKAGKEILQNESIEDNVVLNEEIKRIRQLLK